MFTDDDSTGNVDMSYIAEVFMGIKMSALEKTDILRLLEFACLLPIAVIRADSLEGASRPQAVL